VSDWCGDLLLIAAAVGLVVLNGFFVAAEFALVKIRVARVEAFVREGRPFAGTLRWLSKRLDASLSACQLGITVASLGLGWIGEPAIARLLEPLFHRVGGVSDAVVHGVSFAVAFTAITMVHLVVGEQAPKIYAIRRAEPVALLSSVPLRVFYVLTYPFLVALNAASNWLLRRVGIEGAHGHEVPHDEAEIRAMIVQARAVGEITGIEHQILDAVFDFEERTARQVMVARPDVVVLEAAMSTAEVFETIRRARHTRYPLVEGSLDETIGIVHVKDLSGRDPASTLDLREVARRPQTVPETLPLGRLLRHFQATHQHLALVVDEHGSIAGIVTLENVLEQLIGSVQDEFDVETPLIVPSGSGTYLVQGLTGIDHVNRELGLALSSEEADTLSGLLMAEAGRLLRAGDRIELEGAVAEVVEVRGARAETVRLCLPRGPVGAP
jgi:CBS domain containing-hemolysin-like protein